MIENVLKQWGLYGASAKEVQEYVWNINDAYFLKRYDDPGEGIKTIKIVEQLLKYDMPVAKPVKTVEGHPYAAAEGSIYILSEKLKGNHIEDIWADKELFFKMGKTIAQLHCAFAEIETGMDLWDNSLLEELQGWIKAVLDESGWKLVREADYLRTLNCLQENYEELPRQLIHRDVHFDNFLFDDRGNFSGYIDFDLSQRNIRIFDIGYFLAGLLCEEEGRTISDSEWEKAVSDVTAGYQETLKLTEAEKKALPYVMQAIELLFVAYFIKIQEISGAEDAAKIYYRLF